MKTIALIGCGALSHIFARNLLRILPGEFRITGVMARHAGSAESFAETLDCRFYGMPAARDEKFTRPGLPTIGAARAIQSRSADGRQPVVQRQYGLQELEE